MNKMIYSIAIISSILIFCLGDTSFAQMQNPAVSSLSGEELFIQNRCVRCHTIGRGRFVGPDLSGVAKKYSREEIVGWIENPQQIYQSKGKMPYNEGYPPMPPMNVPQEQAAKIADYILAFQPTADSKSSGSITGQVVNKTSDSPAAGVELTLTSYMGDRPTDEKTIKSDEQGNYSFKGLPWDRSHEISVNYMGAQYATDKMVFNPNEVTKELDLPIYEPTFDENEIEVTEAHMIVQATDMGLSVANIALFNNKGNKMFVGGKELDDGRKESLKISMPKGAQDLNFIHGIDPQNLVQTEYGYADTMSILPGDKRVVYTYSLPLEPGSTEIKQKIDYPTQSFLLLVSESQETVEVSGLSGGEPVDVQGQKFLKWQGSDLRPGDQFEITLKSAYMMSDYLKWGALGFLLLIIAIGLVYSSFFRKKSISEPDEEAVDPATKRSMLVAEIAKLDDDFDAGKIEEGLYRKKREDKMLELKNVIRRL